MLIGPRGRTLALSLAAVAMTGLAEAAPPERIVSLNLCTDQILVDLVPPARIRALSHLASDPRISAVAERAAAMAGTRGDAESVLAFDPDLVLAGSHTTPATLSLLERLDRRVARIPMASDLAGIRAGIGAVAEAVGEREAGLALVARLDAQIAEAASDAPRGGRPSALVYQVNGLSAGAGSLADALMTAAGLANHARALGLGPGGALALETLLVSPPDLIVLSGPADEWRTVVAGNLGHPALAALLAARGSVTVPWRWWLCGTQHAGEAVRQLAEARRRLGPSERKP